PCQQEDSGNGFYPGEYHGEEVRRHWRSHLPLIDDARERRGIEDLRDSGVQKEPSEEEPEDDVERGVPEEGRVRPAQGLSPFVTGYPASFHAGQPSFRMAAWTSWSRSLRGTMWLASQP